MAGINKVIIVGRLGRDPEVRYTPDGMAVANFSVATSDEWRDKNSGEKKEKTEWHRIVAFRKLGEICGEYLSKGSQIYIEGRLRTRSWEKDGVTRYTTEIEAQNVQFLDSGGNREGRPQREAASGGSGRSDRSRDSDWQGGYGGQQTEEPSPSGPDEDDIPF